MPAAFYSDEKSDFQALIKLGWPESYNDYLPFCSFEWLSDT